MYAYAIPQVEPSAVGIHLLWVGPRPWLYSPQGWSIQRRPRRLEEELSCDGIDAAAITRLRTEREARLRFGMLTLCEGAWPAPVPPIAGIPVPHSSACDVFTLELDDPQPVVRVDVLAAASFAIALREGKAVATGGPPVASSASYELRALGIDAVTVYARPPAGAVTSVAVLPQPYSIRFCVRMPLPREEAGWADAPYILKDLRLPLRELMPALRGPADEYAEATTRLLPGEGLDPDQFGRLADTLRAGLRQAGPPRPIDQVLLLRENLGASFEEMIALDPLRTLLVHPKWRRVLGFGWFDRDPTLVPGETYEYRLTGTFPAEDLADTVYGFHTLPSQTALPAEFYLDGLRLRLPQPTRVERAPGTPSAGLVQISRRGIRLRPQDQHFWLLPSLADWSLVLDFPAPVTSVILELHPDHDLECAWGAPSAPLAGLLPVPAGPRPRLDFPVPVQHLRLRGRGFLFAVRIPAGPRGMTPISVVLPPVTLMNTPRPEPPLSALIRNLQQPQPAPEDDTPPAAMPPRHALGFEVIWRPALRDGLAVWPADAPAAPPLDAAVYQIEHRRVTLPPGFPVELLPPVLEVAAGFPAGGAARVPDRLSPELVERLRRVDLPDRARDRLLAAVAGGDATVVVGAALRSATAWKPVLPEENWILGDRDQTARDTVVHPGVDLMVLYPEAARPTPAAGLDASWRDVFDFRYGGEPVRRPPPPPGTYHQYRVRTIDAIGRPALTWRETNVLRLEKHVPPPVPVGPDETPAHELLLPAPVGVQARVLVRGAPDLTAADLALLGPSENAIVLRWGWHRQQRDQDPFAREFRVYIANRPLDAVAGVLSGVTPLWPGVYRVMLALERAVAVDAAKGSSLQAGYPFHIRTHTAGMVVTAELEARVPGPGGALPVPAPGPVLLPLRLTPDLTRPPAWSQRVLVRPLTAATQYEAVIRNRLTLTAAHPRDAVWVGVSAADRQSYVPDQLAPVGTRPGNESGIVPVLCEARYQGRPVFDVPPALAPVPVLVTPEPADRPIFFPLDLRPYLAGTGLGAGDLIRPERASADAVFAAYRATVDDHVMARVVDPQGAGEAESEVAIGNPADRAAVLAALRDAPTSALEDRFVVFLAGIHPYRDRLFQPATQASVPLGPFQETLPRDAGRYVYRVRKADAAGHLSAGGAVAKVIVRVPSMAPGAAPERVAGEAGDPAGTLRLRVAPDPELTHVLTFSQVAAATSGGPIAAAALLRVPNAHDLYPNGGIRLCAPDGTLLPPQAKSLADADVGLDADGSRRVAVTFVAGAGERVRVWACTLTRDGIPSLMGGPWGLAMPVAPLPAPTLAVVPAPPALVFTWSWPSGAPAYSVTVERSAAGASWERLSPPLPETATSYRYVPAAGGFRYRLRVMSPDGRVAHSNTVTP